MDNAVSLFGSTLEAELESVEGKNSKEINGKRTRLMEKWLDMPRKFRSPMASTKKMDVVQEFTVKGEVD